MIPYQNGIIILYHWLEEIMMTNNRPLQKINSKIIIIVGALVVIGILAASTFYSMGSARRSTDEAVNSVSHFYLGELAGRREQVVATNLDKSIANMKVAIGLMEESDLSDMTHLQAFQAKMKKLYELEKFAFVDENGLIYTSLGTQTNIDEYSFDFKTISGPEISIKNLESIDKKVIIAIPVDDMPFEGHRFVASFMEIDIHRMLDGLSLQTDENSATFCNLYYGNGVPLTDIILGGQAEGANIFDVLETARFDNVADFDRMKKDFEAGEEGIISFEYNGTSENLYYIPVRGTNWMLTYLIRDSIIAEKINLISRGIIIRSLIQTIGIAAVMAFFFAIVIGQNKRTNRLILEQERENAANNAIQAELEETLQLQDELLEQEKKARRADAMISAMAADYRSVYYVNLDKDYGLCYRADDNEQDGISEGDSFAFYETFKKYAMERVSEEDRDKFLDFINPDNIRKRLASEALISCRYLKDIDGRQQYEMLRMAGVRRPGKDGESELRSVGVGFSDVDRETRESLIQKKALTDALAQAEEANAAKTSFLSSMSHEIRTPMNAIIGLDSIALKDKDVPEHTREYLEKIGASAKHLLGLINDILDMSRIESGRLTLSNEEFSFKEMLEQINTMVNGQCQDKGLSYKCEVKGSVDDFYIGDDMKLKQVLLNVLGNAVKFTDSPGEVFFKIEPVAKYSGNAAIRFIVQDTGIGMDEDYIPKIFDPFSTENSGNGGKYGSTGLGMAITKNIVEMMNGKIGVESKKGVGSTFTITVSLRTSERKACDMDQEEITPGDMRVLVIDDDPIACEHSKLILEEAGISSEFCYSGKEAYELIKVARARGEAYNLVLTDLKMPEEDGVEVARKIREMSNDESTIIIITAYSWDDIIEKALSVGVDSFMAKPLFASSVIEEFRRIVRDKKQRELMGHKAELSGRHILLAEDMPINAEIIKKILSMRGITVDHASNGVEAVDMFQQSADGTYDAVLMDIRMPELDGLGATERIRALDRNDAKEIPIIALTANAFDEDVQRSLQAGMNAHLSKPIEPDHLYETLEHLIRD
ncbi:MAG: response regulator [Butyrivibrio sp.]|nr:response regulator [Butyrivibrio sp.]